MVSSNLILSFKNGCFLQVSPPKLHAPFLCPNCYHTTSQYEAPTFHFHINITKRRVNHKIVSTLLLSVGYLAMLPAS